MNRFIYKILCGLLVLMVVSCEDNGITSIPESTENSIILNFSTGEGNTSRASGDYVEDTNVEFSVTHLDIFFFKDNDKTLFYYERVSIDNTTTSYGKFRLNKKRNEFSSTENYWVYVVANSTETEENITNTISDLDDLKALQQSDENIHLTGHVNTENLVEGLGSIPSHFLMDGVAYLKPNSEGDFDVPSQEPLAGALNVNDGVAGNTTTLKVILHRAAAKIVVKIKPGDKITFDNSEYSSHAGYYLRNMPYSTTLLSGIENSFVQLRTSTETYSDFIRVEKDNNGKILYKELTLYVYSHTWLGESFYDKGTSLVINVPLLPEDEQNAPNNYYQIKLRDDAKADFERNKYYEVEVEVNAAGATVPERPIELPVLRYSTYDWTGVDVNVGSMVTPHYLKLNKDTVRIYNSDIDASLYYTSSSPVTITIEKNTEIPTPYFVSKYGVNKYVGKTISDKMVAVEAIDGALSGNINIYSPNPTNYAIRYFTINVTNEDGLTEIITVEQYPVIWITNIEGWYSYREDSNNGDINNVTHYERRAYPYKTNCRWDRDNPKWVYEVNFWISTPDEVYTLFRPEVNTSVDEPVENRDTPGAADLYYYDYGGSNNGLRRAYYMRSEAGNCPNSGVVEPGNARMYHIHVSSTSSDYIVGRPRMVGIDPITGEPYTATTTDNNKLVSPSFALASQLGITEGFSTSVYSSSNYLKAAQQHCARYVETYKDRITGKTIHLKNWRLPTKAELDFISEVQSSDEDAAINVILTGAYYMGAASYVENKKYSGTSSSVYIRCVRDVYEE